MPRSDPRPPVILIIRDGWGENPHPAHDSFNAIKIARTPCADDLRSRFPETLITTSGEKVGLPQGTMGNSEVGHQNIGAGRIVDQELMRITRSIRDGTFFANPTLRGAFDHTRTTGGRVHLLGLVSDGRVHSDIDHLFALIDMAAQMNWPTERLLIHTLTDGRDTGPKTGAGFIERVEQKVEDVGLGRIATVIGRYYAMDRDHRWERTARSYAALTGADGARLRSTALDAVTSYYETPDEASRSGDEFIPPTTIGDAPPIQSGDSVIFFNFRGDRPRQLTRAFMLDDAAWAEVNGGGFDRGEKLDDLFFCTMTAYEQGLPVSGIAFPKPPPMANILGAVIAQSDLTQFRCAETEKFAHVTFFFNDYREEPFEGEQRLLCPSPKDVTTYDQKPEMSAHDVCTGVLARLHDDDCEPFILVNFANPDMVGHTGNLDAVVRAVEVVDECVGRIVDAALARGGACVVTADHGNAEQMWNPETESPHTAHTTYDVPLILVSEQRHQLRGGGILADIAPTVLALMNIDQPAEMTGRSLII